MNKQQVEQIILSMMFSDTLGGNESWKHYTCGLILGCDGCENLEKRIIAIPILIGDVIEKMKEMKERGRWTIVDLGLLWRSCGITKSLQQIVEESGWEWCCDECSYPILSEDGGCERSECEGNDNEEIEQLKSPQARALLKSLSLASLFLKN